jgi:D-alanyl-D-alanine carboxypeptidase
MDNKYLILVNKNNPMKNEDLYDKVLCDSIYANDRMLEKETYKSFLKLQKFVYKKGYNIAIESGYRSYEYQKKVWDECVLKHGVEHTKKFVAKPGYSEHQTGLAVDFLLYENGVFYIEHKLKNHPILKIINDNAYKFGFIIRYEFDKELITGYGYEPWHLRYVGSKKIAKEIKDKNICLEEYLTTLTKKD